MNLIQASPLDKSPIYERILELVKDGEFNTTIANSISTEYKLSVSEAAIRRFRKRHHVQIPGVEKTSTSIQGDVAQAVTPVHQTDPEDNYILDDPDTMLRERGLSPEDWVIDSISVNEWDARIAGGAKITNHQAKFTAKRKNPELLILPVRSDGWKPSKITIPKIKGEPELVVICGDYQAPFYDKNLHRLFLQWLTKNKPSRGIDLGDLLDFPDISRHPDDPRNVAIANECMQSGFETFRDRVSASPETDWEWMPGNHDQRLYDYVVKNAPRIANLKTVDADTPGKSIYSLQYLMRLDELGVKFHDPKGPYDLGQINLSSNLAVRHGWIVRAKSGESAYKSLEKTGYSILVGHTHRQAIVQHTIREIDGTPRQLLAAEIGHMCRLDDQTGSEDDRIFPSYTPFADWQAGFATATIYPDGKFKVDLASYVNGTLLYRDQRYE